MRSLVITSGLLLVTCLAQPIDALRFEGSWKLAGPDNMRNCKLEFQVTGDAYTATYYHPFPTALSDIHIQGDSFTASYIDDFGSRVNLTAQLRGSELQIALAPEGRPPLIFSGSRVAPDPTAPRTHQASGTVMKAGKNGSAQFVVGGHTYAFSGGVDGNCFNASVGKDGKGVSFSGCGTVSTTPK